MAWDQFGASRWGAVFVQVITSYLDNYQPWGFQINDLYMYIGALLIVMMIFRPAGLMPSRRRKREIDAFERPVKATSTRCSLENSRERGGDGRRKTDHDGSLT